MERISYVKLVMLDKCGKNSLVRLVRLGKLYELDQVGYDS